MIFSEIENNFYYRINNFDATQCEIVRRKNLNFPTVRLEFQNVAGRVPKNVDTEDALSYQVKACAREILKASGISWRKDPELYTEAAIILKPKIWDAISSDVYFAEGETDPMNRFVYVLGDNANEVVKHRHTGAFAVMEGTKIALPFSQNRTFYAPLDLNEEEQKLLGGLEWRGMTRQPFNTERENIVSKRSSKKKDSFKADAWIEPTATSALEALGAKVEPQVIGYCLKREYVLLSPWDEKGLSSVRREHHRTIDETVEYAKKACLKKWGNVIPRETIEDFFHLDNGNVLYNIHHKIPTSWGGGNGTRTVMDLASHARIHEDETRIQKEIISALREEVGKNGPDIIDLPSSAEWLRRYLPKNPRLVMKLNKLDNVRVTPNGQVSMNILWPSEPFCISGLLQWEKKYGVQKYAPSTPAFSKRGVTARACRAG